jgi:hypothetical protein
MNNVSTDGQSTYRRVANTTLLRPWPNDCPYKVITKLKLRNEVWNISHSFIWPSAEPRITPFLVRLATLRPCTNDIYDAEY